MIDLYGRVLTLGLVGLFFSVTQSSPIWANNLKIIELTQKMSTIASMQQKIQLRAEQAKNVRTELTLLVHQYVDEVLNEQRRLKTTVFKIASQTPRIYFDLQLIGRLNAYIRLLNQRIDHFELGQQRMAYLYQQAEDDLKLIETLNDMQVDDLTGRIESLVAEYTNDLHNNLIDFADLPESSPESVWQDVIAGRLSGISRH